MNTRTSKNLAITASVLALLVALTAFSIAGCSSDSVDDTSATNPTGPAETTTTVANTGAPEDTTVDPSDGSALPQASLALTEADNGKSFTVSVGATITVELAGNATTGYSWDSDLADEAAPLLILVGGKPSYLQSTTGTNVVGSGGQYVFTFTAAAAGQVDLKLKYWRPFEAQAEPLQTFSAKITIR